MNADLFHVGSRGGRLAVVAYSGTGEPILLLHGGPGCPDYLAPVARLLAPTHKVVTFHQRGVGPSEALDGRYDLDAYLANIEAVRVHVGCDRWHVFGHSWGGVLAQLYARAHPNRVLSLFLCDAALGVGDDWRRSRRAVARHMLRAAGARTLAAVALCYAGTWLPGRVGTASARGLYRRIWRVSFPDPRHADPPADAWLRGVNRRALHGTQRAVLAAATDALPGHWPDAPWPVLVLYGGADIFGDASGVVRARFPAAAQIRLDAAAHLPWLQAPAAFREALTGFYGPSAAASGRLAPAEPAPPSRAERDRLGCPEAHGSGG